MRRTRQQQRPGRLHTATTSLAASRERLENCLRQVHPARDCLPIPPLVVPTDRPGFDTAIAALCANLFTPAPRVHNAPRWLAAHQNCPHLPTTVVVNINDLIWRWYKLLIAARRHVDNTPDDPYDLTWCIAYLDERIAGLATSTGQGHPAH